MCPCMQIVLYTCIVVIQLERMGAVCLAMPAHTSVCLLPTTSICVNAPTSSCWERMSTHVLVGIHLDIKFIVLVGRREDFGIGLERPSVHLLQFLRNGL